jgi:hypothetical protein
MTLSLVFSIYNKQPFIDLIINTNLVRCEVGECPIITSGVQSVQSNIGVFFHFLHTTFSSMLKSRISSILSKTETLRINLNLDGTPITFKSHTHLFRCSGSTTNPVYVRRVNSFVLVCSLSSHRHSYIHLIFNSRFLDS